MEISTWSPSTTPHRPHAYAQDIRDLQRSLSRSPSRLDTNQHQSRLSRRSTPAGSPFCLSKPRPSLARTSPIKIFSEEHSTTPRQETTSSEAIRRSTIRRALSTASDNGNSSTTPQSSPPNADGQENSMMNHPGGSQSAPQIQLPIFKLDSPRAITPGFRSRSREWRPAKSSPLKRSDAVMNLNHTSPASKWRTICAGKIRSPFETFRDSLDDSMDDSEAEVTTSNETSMDITSVLAVSNTRR